MTEWIITSSVLIAIIVATRFLLRGKISLGLQYALWLLVAIRLVLPFSVFESSASVLNIFQHMPEISSPTEITESIPEEISPSVPENIVVPDEDIFILDDYAQNIGPETGITVDYETGFVAEPEIRVIDFASVLKGVWLFGVVVFGGIFLFSNLRFAGKLRKSAEYVPEKAWLPVMKTPEIETPCLFGTINPKIYVLPEIFEHEDSLHHVIEHETTHYFHRDNIWAVLRCFCVALHWYNPLVWLAAFLSMRDCELACDEATIKRLGEEQRFSYGKTLIGLTQRDAPIGILRTATTMTGTKSSIKERITLIAKKPKMLRITVLFVAIIAIFATACTFTGAHKINPKTAENEVPADMISMDKRVYMEVFSVSEKEIETTVFSFSEHEVSFSVAYRLNFEQDGKWYELPILDEKHEDMNEDMLGFATILVNGEYNERAWVNNFYEAYGSLPDGKYRIIRNCRIRDKENSETLDEFFIGAEFELAGGEIVIPILKGDYIAEERIYHNSVSSFLGMPEYLYSVTENAFIITNFSTGDEIANIEVPLWHPEEFPYSEEEWEELFFAGIGAVDISGFEKKFWQPLDENYSLACMDYELWLLETVPVKPGADEYMFMNIYKLDLYIGGAKEKHEETIIARTNQALRKGGYVPENYDVELFDVEDETLPDELLKHYSLNCDEKYMRPVVYRGRNTNRILLAHPVSETEVLIHDFHTHDRDKESWEYTGDYRIDLLAEKDPVELTAAEVGDIVSFGNYEGSKNWIVLDKEGTKLLLLSEKCLDARPYHDEREDVTWETCDLRQWLNGEFYNQTFNKSQREFILETKLSNPDNTRFMGAEGGRDTTDKIFLLSYDEAHEYLPLMDEKESSLTSYAESKEIWKTKLIYDTDYTWWWWLRSPGLGQDMAAVCCGPLNSPGNDGLLVDTICGIRPAMWIDISPALE